jgi:TRAP-type transport system small permease protein
VLNHSLFWSEEVGRICLVWITFLGASAVYKKRGHLGIDFFVSRLPQRWFLWTQVLVQVCSLVFFWVLVFYGCSYVAFVSGQKTAALGMPMALPCAVIPLSGLFFFLHGITHLLELLACEGSEP